MSKHLLVRELKPVLWRNDVTHCALTKSSSIPGRSFPALRTLFRQKPWRQTPAPVGIKARVKTRYKGNVTTHLIRGSQPRRLNARLALIGLSLSLSLSLSLDSFEFYHVPLCRPNLSAFFDSGHGFAYAANFLLTFLDHTRYGNARIPREWISDDSPRYSSVKLNIWNITKKHPDFYRHIFSGYLTYLRLKIVIKRPRPLCHRLCVTNRILLMRMNFKSMGFPVIAVNSVKTFIWKINTFTSVT